MSNGSEAPQSIDRQSAERLSAFIDGELEVDAVSAACLAWRDDATARADWHAFHLIGDVLRSDDLASSGSRDSDFLARLRVRMAAEPIVFAPVEAPVAEQAAGVEVKRRVGAGRNSRWAWAAPSAVAAGFVVVAGALMVTNPGLIGGASQDASLAASSQPLARVATVPSVAPALAEGFSPAAAFVAPDRKLIRDAKLDRYLSAHKEFAGSTALGVPSGFLRDAVAESPSR